MFVFYNKAILFIGIYIKEENHAYVKEFIYKNSHKGIIDGKIYIIKMPKHRIG